MSAVAIWGNGSSSSPIVQSGEYDELARRAAAQHGVSDADWYVVVECDEADLDEQTRFDQATRGYCLLTDGPLHYVANTVYHAEQGKPDYARESAVAPDATLAELSDESWLLTRLPALMTEFRAAVESLGFVYEEVSK